MRKNSRKRVITEQNYEDYWKVTLANTAFFDDQFIRTLDIIIKHIDEHDLSNKPVTDLIKNPNVKGKSVNEGVVKYKELQEKIKFVYSNDDKSGASTRKQINQYIKLGFIKPFLKGYVPAAKEYVKANKSIAERKRLFSDTVYEYASLNSAVTNDDTKSNQVKFIVKTLLNRKLGKLNMMELIGIMQLNINEKDYAKENEIISNQNWAITIEFAQRKYNQISHLRAILRNLELFETVGRNAQDYNIALVQNAKDYLPQYGDTKRDTYRFSLMKKAVINESKEVYGKPICWFSKHPSQGLVVSHIYASHKALKNWDIDEAYDPNNAFLLKPGDIDGYFDKYKMTINEKGFPVFSEQVRSDFIEEAKENNYKIDDIILNEKRKYYLKIHNKEFESKL